MITDKDFAFICRHVDFHKIRDAKVLITGGTGFVGTWMRQCPSYIHTKSLSKLDFYSFKWMKERWDFIIHLAPVDSSTICYYDLQNRNSTRVLLASSGAVYHQYNTGYRDTKVLSEKQLAFCNCDFVSARMFTFAGANMRIDGKALVSFIYNARRNKPIEIIGNGSTIRTYMYAADMSVWLWNLLLHGKQGECYNVGSDQPVTILELAKKISGIFGGVSIVIKNEEQDICPWYVPDISKAKRELGLSVYTSFEDTIQRTAETLCV